MPVANDNDFLILGNLAAFKLMVMAIIKEERNLFAEAQAYESKAVGELQNDLSSFEGDGVIPVLRLASPDVYGGAVENSLGWAYGGDYGYYR